MKPLIVLACLFSSIAFADFKTPIAAVSRISVDRENMKLTYGIGGGCKKHTALVEVDVVTHFVTKEKLVDVKVTDVVAGDQQDFCEAYISVSAEVNLQAMVREATERAGLKAGSYKVRLPSVQVSTYE